jgi:hypothetical protein
MVDTERTYIGKLLAHLVGAAGLAVIEPAAPIAHALVHVLVARSAAAVVDRGNCGGVGDVGDDVGLCLVALAGGTYCGISDFVRR